MLSLLILQVWSMTAGRSYMGHLLHNQNVGFDPVGVHGLWLRELFELDPMLELLLVDHGETGGATREVLPRRHLFYQAAVRLSPAKARNARAYRRLSRERALDAVAGSP